MNPENWNWAMWALMVLIGLNVVLTIAMHGKPRVPYNGLRALYDAIWVVGLLYFAGALA
jgi:hypothetical protein